MGRLLEKQLAFKSMATFITILHEQLGWDELPPLLGSMALIDGVPLDAAIAEDWKGAVDQAFTDSRSPDAVAGLTVDQAYCAVVHFLDARFRKGQMDIGQILNEIRSTDFPPELMVEWNQSIALAFDSTKSISAVIVKDGVSYEIHSAPHGKGDGGH